VAIAPWWFPVGERLEYSVTFGRLRLGEASLGVEAIDSVWSRPAYRVALEIEGGPPFYRLEDRQAGWVTPDPLASLRFDQKLHQGSYRRDRRFMLDPETQTFTRYDNVDGEYVRHEQDADVPMPDGALDDISFLYLLRLLPLEVGDRYVFERHFKESGNPVIMEVLRREEIRVPAGRFRTIVVRPIILTGGLFGDGGEAELYVSNDERRLIVRIKTIMKVGSVNLYLTGYEPGLGGPGIPAHGASAAADPPAPGEAP
jgi:hypothetical protein